MKKSNNKRTKRLRMKYKKTKRNVKRRTLRKTRHRQSGGLPTTTILSSTLPVGRVMFNTIVSSLRNQSNIVGKKLKEEIKEAAVTTFKENNGKEFTFGHHGPNELKKYTNFFNELGKTIRNKLQKKTIKETMDNIKDMCLLDETDKQTFTSANITRQIYYKNPTASAVAPSQKKSLYPINMYNYEKINLDQVKQLQKKIGIDDETSAEDITKKINAFVDTLEIEALSKCNMPSQSMHSATTTGSKKYEITSGSNRSVKGSNRSVKGSKTLTSSQ